MKNLDLVPAKLSTFRKIALGTWNRAGDPSVYGVLELDASKILDRQKRWAEKKGSKAPTITAIVARAIALTMQKHPQINGLIRWGRIYLRKNVTLFLQTAVDDAGEELSGVSIENAQNKSIEVIVDELKSKAKAIREDKDPNFKQAKSTFRNVPAFLTRYLLDLLSFFLYSLNLDMRWAGLPRDPFGSIMITSVGMLGLEEGFAPLVPYSRVPILIMIGAVKEHAVVRDGKIVISPMFKICATFDHRFIDGVYAGKMVKTVKHYLETDAGLDELGI